MATATGIFQYDDGQDLVEGVLLGHGQTPQDAAEDAQARMTTASADLSGFSVTDILPGNPFDL